jgi:hypothetical protein
MGYTINILEKRQLQAGAMAVKEKKWFHLVVPWK